MFGLQLAHFAAAACALLAIPLMQRWKLQPDGIDLAPSMHWPVPVVSREIEDDAGPVLVTVEYDVPPNNREQFLVALEQMSAQRRRDGAYAWGVFEDTAAHGRFLETFLLDSWVEHLRQHERVTEADRKIEERVRGLLQSAPKVAHFITPV
jgi:hypothetical protein